MSSILPPASSINPSSVLTTEPAAPTGWPGAVVPNFSDWRPGDIVLVRGPKGTAGTMVRLDQALSTNGVIRSSREWTHAAVYVGDGCVIDATYGQPIAERSLWDYCERRAITVRRVRPSSTVTRQDIEDTANAVRGFLGLPYGTWDVIFDAIWPRSLPVRSRRSLYCSTLVEAAIAEATQLRLSSLPAHRPMYPAVLAGHPLLLGVPLEWRVPDGP